MKFPSRLRPCRAGRATLLRLGVVAAVSLTLGLVFAFIPGGDAIGGVEGALAGAWMAASAVAYAKWQAKLGKFTTVAAIAVVWALTMLVVSLLAPHCGSLSGGHCSATVDAQWTVSGFLLPVVPAVALFPMWWLFKLGRLVMRPLWRQARYGKAAPVAATAKRRTKTATGHRDSGRVTPKGTKPAKAR